MDVLHALKLSLLIPIKPVVFQLNRVKTKVFLLYILFLHGLISLPNGARLITNSINSEAFSHESLLILVLYPLFIIIFGLVGISLLASIGLLIKTITKRKLVYQLLWKMTVYALTYSVILYTFLEVLGIMSWIVNVLLLALFLMIFLKMILSYPKIRKKQVK